LERTCIFDPVEHAYVDQHRQRHRSVTQVLTDSGCVDFSMVDPVVLRVAAERGTAVHVYSAMWDAVRGQQPLTDFLDTVPEHLRGYLRQYEAFLRDTHFQADHSETERPRLVEIHGTIVGMTPDRVGLFPPSRRPSVVDIKTGCILLSHPLQIAGYSMGIERVMALAKMHDRVALYLEPERYRLRWHTSGQDYYAFLDALHGGGHYLETWKSHRTRKAS
jgi:hypothetical protein